MLQDLWWACDAVKLIQEVFAILHVIKENAVIWLSGWFFLSIEKEVNYPSQDFEHISGAWLLMAFEIFIAPSKTRNRTPGAL